MFGGGSNMKDRDQKKLKKKMNSREIVAQREEQRATSKQKNQKQKQTTFNVIKEMREDAMHMI